MSVSPRLRELKLKTYGSSMYRIPVFLSAPKCFMKAQEDFLLAVEEELWALGLEPRTLGRSDYDMDAPLEGIRRIMIGSCGLLAIAFRRTQIESGRSRPGSDIGEQGQELSGCWFTSPYIQIEPAMAFQLGLPMLIWREAGVVADGILDRGTIGVSTPEFNLDGAAPDLKQARWSEPLKQWGTRVRMTHERRGAPPRLWS